MHQYYSHLIQQQSPPTGNGLNMYSSSSAGSYYLFPLPLTLANAVLQVGYDKEIHTTLKQIGKYHHHQHHPQAHSPLGYTYAKDGKGFNAESRSDLKHKHSKSKKIKLASNTSDGFQSDTTQFC